jgi:hypothetical protein
LNGSGIRGILTPVDSPAMKEERPAHDERRNRAVQRKRSGEVDAEPFTVAGVVSSEMGVRGYGTLLTASTAG